MEMILRKRSSICGQETLIPCSDIEFNKRIISVTGEITDQLAENVNSALRLLANSSEDVMIYINSPGGSVTAGMAIYDTITAVPYDVRTVASGITASIAAILLAAGTPGKRYCQPSAEIMIHQPYAGVGQQSQASDLEIQAAHIKRIRHRLNGILAQKTGQPLEKIQIDTERDHFMDAAEAVAYGLADKIGDPSFFDEL